MVIYYRVREERFYEQLYKQKNQRRVKKQTNDSKKIGMAIDETLVLTDGESARKEGSSAILIDDFSTINIEFFTEELFYYLMEVMHATAAMAYTYGILTRVLAAGKIFSFSHTKPIRCVSNSKTQL